MLDKMRKASFAEYDQYSFVESHSEGEDDDAKVDTLNPLAEQLVKRCSTLLDEVERFQRHLNHIRNKKATPKCGIAPVELRHFKGAIQLELRTLEAVSSKSGFVVVHFGH